MLTLNILPEGIKKDIKLKRLQIKLKNLFGILLVMASAYSMALLAGKYFIQNYYIKTAEKTSAVTKSIGKNYSQRIKDLNVQMESAGLILKDFTPWSYLIEEISACKNDGVRLESLSIKKAEAKISFGGTAASRDDLQLFKAKLEESGIFKEIDFPISNLVKKDNIPFTLNAKIKSYDFIKN